MGRSESKWKKLQVFIPPNDATYFNHLEQNRMDMLN